MPRHSHLPTVDSDCPYPQRRLRAFRAIAHVAAASVICLACAIRPPVLNRLAVGCYEVDAEPWSAEMTELVGFTLPQHVYLDSSLAGGGSDSRQARPTGWDLRTSWTNTSGDWLRLPGDTIIVVRGATVFHELGADSIIVNWSGPGGSVAAYLEPTTEGFAGLAQLSPRQFARDLPTPRVELRRTTCSGSLP